MHLFQKVYILGHFKKPEKNPKKSLQGRFFKGFSRVSGSAGGFFEGFRYFRGAPEGFSTVFRRFSGGIGK